MQLCPNVPRDPAGKFVCQQITATRQVANTIIDRSGYFIIDFIYSVLLLFNLESIPKLNRP